MSNRELMYPYGPVREVVAERYGALIQALRDIAEEGCRLYREHSAEQAPSPTPLKAEYYHRLYLIGALRHTLTLLESTITLLESGLIHGARVTTRPLFEILVNTKHIVAEKNHPLAWQLFYSAKSDHLVSHSAALQAMDPEAFPAAAIERTQGQVTRIEGDLRELAGPEVEDRDVVRWAGKKLSFSKLAQTREMKIDYLAVYKDLSWDTHGTLALLDITRRTPEGVVVVRDALDLEGTRFVAISAGRWAVQVFEIVASEWKAATQCEALATRLLIAAEETVNPALPEMTQWMKHVREKDETSESSP